MLGQDNLYTISLFLPAGYLQSVCKFTSTMYTETWYKAALLLAKSNVRLAITSTYRELYRRYHLTGEIYQYNLSDKQITPLGVRAYKVVPMKESYLVLTWMGDLYYNQNLYDTNVIDVTYSAYITKYCLFYFDGDCRNLLVTSKEPFIKVIKISDYICAVTKNTFYCCDGESVKFIR